MLDKKGIVERLFVIFDTKTRTDIAKYFKVTWPTVRQWQLCIRPVPWGKLRKLVADQGISWDWLLAGNEPQLRIAKHSIGTDFDRIGINERFLSLFAGRNKTDIAQELGVTHSAVCSWYSFRRQVPWEKLRYATVTYGVTWDWLLEGMS